MQWQVWLFLWRLKPDLFTSTSKRIWTSKNNDAWTTTFIILYQFSISCEKHASRRFLYISGFFFCRLTSCLEQVKINLLSIQRAVLDTDPVKGLTRGLNPSCCLQNDVYPHRLMMVTNTIVASRKDCKLKNSPCLEIEKVIIHLTGINVSVGSAWSAIVTGSLKSHYFCHKREHLKSV